MAYRILPVSTSISRTLPPADNAADPRKLREITAGTHGVRDIRFSPDGTRAVTAGSDLTVRIWDLERGIDVRQLAGHTALLRAAEWLPDGQTIVSADRGGHVKVWDAETGQLSDALGLGGDVRGMKVIGNGNQIAFGVRRGNEAYVQIWDLRSKRLVSNVEADVRSMDISPDGRWVATGGITGQIEVRELRGQSVRSLGSHGLQSTCVRFSADGSLLLSSGFDGAVRIWDLGSGEMIDRLPCGKNGAGVMLTADQEFVVVTGHGVNVWHLDSRTLVHTLDTQAGPCDIDAEGRLLLVSNGGSTIELWELPDRTQ